MLLFKKKFLEAIRRGEKTQTIRLWSHPRMKAGQRSYIPGVGYIRIESVEAVELAALTDADAIPDGFPTADALRAEIANIYSQELRQRKQPYRVRFCLTDPVPAAKSRPSERKLIAPVKRSQMQSSRQMGLLPKPLLPIDGFLLVK